ncbi:MAG TPA: GNAT family N-acetyltransferase [Candidatus Sulfotelmatobacter sp.]|jgi:hypothetical protein|nr:GNAT family N-acetyltransferase [Candidatus Sulfotelmatobacter sp.]
MSLATPISEIAVRSTSAAIHAGWSELRREELSAWNNALRKTNASIHQYPFWNEPYRQMGVRPRYLAWGNARDPLAFATVLTVGFGPAKIGLVFRGPTQVADTGFRSPRAMFRELLEWGYSNGYMFLRFTHSDPQVLSDIAMAGNALDVDAFPYLVDYPVLSSDYIVPQHDSEEKTVAAFDREARRKIRRGTEAGYEFRSDDSPDALQKVWPLYQDCARRKQFRIERPLSFYMELMRGAQSHNRVRLYTVSLNGKMVGSTVTFRDRTTAHCLLAAFDIEHRHSAAFLHWHTMRDSYRLGASYYNLGPGPGSLARFKSQFCQTPTTYPAPLTMVLKEGWFRLWGKAFVPMAKQLHPMVRRLALQRAALTR